MFYGLTNLKTVSLDRLDTSLSTGMDNMFYNCMNLKNITFPETFDTSKVQTFEGMFEQCNSLEKIDLSGFDFSVLASILPVSSICPSSR